MQSATLVFKRDGIYKKIPFLSNDKLFIHYDDIKFVLVKKIQQNQNLEIITKQHTIKAIALNFYKDKQGIIQELQHY
ncbi:MULTISPECIES: hypothetical protein [unclassified Acinetobacter]|uniref:hypothetical protein n=1 Tax=unclassified Acinetobacter TaxID=196816 RepID=UPI0035BB18FE